MAGLGWSRAAWLLLLGGCTPLGLWLYEDPVVTVARITLEMGGGRPAGSSPVIVALAVQNKNYYSLATERVELALRLDGAPIGQLRRDSTVDVAMDTVSLVALALPLQERTTPEHLKEFRSGTHMFTVRGRATFHTPIGTRKVRFAQEGAMVFGVRSRDSSP